MRPETGKLVRLEHARGRAVTCEAGRVWITEESEGQDIFLAAEATRGDLKDIEYLTARQMDIRSARSSGLDVYMDENRLDAVLFPGTAGAAIAAKAGYPSVQVPAGFVSQLNGRATPEYPVGATFTGRAWSEAALLRIAYAFEQATLARRMPPNLPGLAAGCSQ